MPNVIFPNYPSASWQAFGRRKIYFAVEDIDESGGNRLVPHERARRNGAKYDDTGSKPRVFNVASPFYTTCEDPQVDAANLYPIDLNDMIDSFTVHEVGDLILPTRGPIRARLQDYRRRETFAERDAAGVSFTFVEDNEDGVLTSSFLAPSARAVASQYGEAAEFSLSQQGIPSTDFGVALSELASEIENLAGQPFEYIADLQTKATQIRGAQARILDAFSAGGDQQGGLLLDPVSAAVHSQLATFADTVSRAVAEKLSSRPKLRIVKYNRVVGLPQVAADKQQDLDALLAANPQIGNPFAVQPGTPINYYATF